MRVAKLQVRLAMLAVLALSASSCQTAQKPASLLPAKAAPPLTALTAPPPEPAPRQTQPASAPVPIAKPLQVQAQAPVQAPAQAAPPSEIKPESPPPPAASDLVADLIASVEKDYQAGLDAYQAGQTDTAKQDFDKALNALLESNLDIRSDDRLQKEFDHVVEGINRLDLGS